LVSFVRLVFGQAAERVAGRADRAVQLEDVDLAATRAGIPRQLRPRQSAA
jgi:hypothetical protein